MVRPGGRAAELAGRPPLAVPRNVALEEAELARTGPQAQLLHVQPAGRARPAAPRPGGPSSLPSRGLCPRPAGPARVGCTRSTGARGSRPPGGGAGAPSRTGRRPGWRGGRGWRRCAASPTRGTRSCGGAISSWFASRIRRSHPPSAWRIWAVGRPRSVATPMRRPVHSSTTRDAHRIGGVVHREERLDPSVAHGEGPARHGRGARPHRPRRSLRAGVARPLGHVERRAVAAGEDAHARGCGRRGRG